MAKKKRATKGRSVRGARGARSTPVEGRSEASIEIIARGCVVEGSRVLLCRNVKHGYLYLPGGHVEFGESAAQALAREFVEECGRAVKVGPLRLVSEGAFFTKKRQHHEINLVFHVELVGYGKDGKRPAIRSKEDGIAFEWVDLSAVVDFDIRPASAKAWLMTLGTDSSPVVDWVSEIV